MSNLRKILEQEEAEKGRLREITREFVGVNEDGSERWVEIEYRTVIRREWTGLDKSDMNVLRGVAVFTSDVDGFIKLVEAKLKEKNT